MTDGVAGAPAMGAPLPGTYAMPVAQAHGTRAMLSIAATGGAQAWRIAISFASAAILGRLLSPSDFGLMAASAPVLAFALMLQNLGLNQAVIQRDDISVGQIDAVFWISVAVSAVLAFALAATAPLFALFFRDARLTALVAASSGLVLLAGLSQQPMALLSRRLSFGTLAIIDMLSVAAGLIAATAIAWRFQSYWALFAASAVAAVTGTVGAWSLSGWRPAWPVFDRGVGEMIRFGAGLSVFSFFNYLARNADNLLIARYRGPYELGLYDRAYKLMLFPLMQSTYPLGRVMQPILSRLQKQPDRYRTAYLDCVALLMASTQPGILFAIVFARPLMLLLLGDRWGGAAPIFMWLGLSGLHQVFTATTGWLFVSQGRGRSYAYIGIFGSVTSILAFAAGLHWGAVGVAACYAISDIALRMPVTWWAAGASGPVGRRDIARVVLPHAASIATAAIALSIMHRQMPRPDTAGLALALALSYAVALPTLACFATFRRAATRLRLMLSRARAERARVATP